MYFYISQGLDAGVLVSGDGSQVDDFVEGVWAYADFHAREERPQPDTVRVRIFGWSDHAGYSVVNLLVVRELRQVLDHFAVRVEKDTVEHGTSASITVIAQDASNNEVPIDGNTPLTFTVDKPEYGSIEPASGVTYAVARAGGVRYLANGTNPLTPQRIRITVTGAGKSGSGSVVVKRKNVLDHFAVRLEKDTVAFTETSKIFVQAKDVHDRDVELDGNTLMRFSIDSTAYGSFIGANGDTVPSPLSNVLYSDARAGNIRFAAVKNNPDSVVTLKLTVELQSDATKKGEKEIVVRRKVIVKLIVGANQLRPLGDGDNKKVISGGDTLVVIDFSRVRTTTATVRVTDPHGRPVANYPFTLRALVRPNSGGHDHDASRPTGRLIKGADTSATIQDRTDAAGQRQYTYLSSGFGGVDSLFVQGETARDTASATIVLKIADFEELTAGSNYRLIGQTTTHRRNHYGTANTIKKLKMLADSAYAYGSWILQYNDISLIYGGPFDHTANWNTPHRTHREGRNVDMRPRSADGQFLDASRIRFLVKERLNGGFSEESRGSNNHHFHLTF